MKCPNCSYLNEPNSVFCQDCGFKLSSAEEVKKEKSTNPIKEFENEIADVLFTPKHKDNSLRNAILIIVGVVIIIFGLLVVSNIYSNQNSATSDSQNTTNETSVSPTPYNPDVAPGSTFDLSYLSLTNTKMYGNSYNSVNPSFVGTLYNSSNLPASDVILRIRFYNSNDDLYPQDTEYINAATYLGAGDSTSINTYIKTNFDTSGNFLWKADIYSAK